MSDVCKVPGCTRLAMPGASYCFAHFCANEAEKKANRMAKKNQGGAVFWQLVATQLGNQDTVNGIYDLVNVGLERAKQQFFQGQQPPPQQQYRQQAPPPQQPSQGQMIAEAFAVLGLDPNTATIKDVRSMQRELAKIYHPDKNPSPAAQERLQKVNLAADYAIKHLRGKGQK